MLVYLFQQINNFKLSFKLKIEKVLNILSSFHITFGFFLMSFNEIFSILLFESKIYTF